MGHSKALRFLLAFALGVPLCVLPLRAERIDVTGQTSVSVRTGQQLAVEFGVWNYGKSNPDYSVYPTELSFTVAGTKLDGHPVATLDGSTLSYFPDILFTGWLESLDGSVSFPLYDPPASALGLPLGSMLATLGAVTIGSDTVETMVLSGQIFLSDQEAQLLFGTNLSNYNDAAVFRIKNLGESFTVGFVPGYPLHAAISESVRGYGPVQTSGITGSVTLIHNPEPSTWILLSGGLVGILVFARRRTVSGVNPQSSSRAGE